MKNKIEIGDKVKVDFTPINDVICPYFYAEVLHVPQDTGDMFHFRAESGDIIYVNPNCSRLETIILFTDSAKEPSTKSRIGEGE